MGVGRLAPHRVRSAYAKALAAIPLPVRSFTGIEPDHLEWSRRAGRPAAIRRTALAVRQAAHRECEG